MPSQGPLVCGSGANDASVGTVAWSNPGNIATAGVATYTAATSISNYLKGFNYGFTIPPGSTIDGIEVIIRRSITAGVANDDGIRIVKGGAISATNRSAGALWSSGALADVTFGSPSDLWGETWSYTDINASTFGVVFSLATAGVSPATVDSISIKVYYSAGSILDAVGSMGNPASAWLRIMRKCTNALLYAPAKLISPRKITVA